MSTTVATGAGGGVVSDAREARERAGSLQVICSFDDGGGIGMHSADLAPRSTVVPAPGALRAATNGRDYRIVFASDAGDTVRVVERTDVHAEPITDEEWREEERKFREYRDGLGDATCDPPALPRPDARRMIVGLWFDTGGRLWVERDSGPAATRSPDTPPDRLFDVFDSAGRLLAQVPSPARLDRVPPFITDAAIYLVVTDDLDVEYVKAFDLVTSGATGPG